jgi:hypothetical protein
MASEKAKDNKSLMATCVACQKSFSTEIMVGLAGSEDGKRRQYPVCVACADKGWRPPGFSSIYRSRST